MRIQHNIAALNSYRNYTNNTGAVSKNLEKLSSGYRINRAGDDAAGLAISEKMRAQITGLETAQKNAQDGVSLVQTAEGALTEVHSMLNRMVELANQSANGVYDNNVDRANLQKEFEALTDEIDRIADATNFNGINLLDGKLDGRYYGSKLTGMDDTGNKAGIDINFAAEGVGGKGFELKFVKGTSSNSATIAGNVITVTLSTTALKDGLSASDLQGIIKSVETEDEDLKAALKSLTITGQGIIGTKKDSGSLWDDAATAIKSIKTNPTSEALSLQIGDTADKYNQLRMNIQDMHADKLSLDQISVDNPDHAKDALEVLKNAINTVSSVRGDLGAAQNRLEHTMNNLSVTSENMTAAESRIRDVDVAKEMMAYTKNNILVQSAQAMLAQANQQPQGVLQLLQ